MRVRQPRRRRHAAPLLSAQLERRPGRRRERRRLAVRDTPGRDTATLYPILAAEANRLLAEQQLLGNFRQISGIEFNARTTWYDTDLAGQRQVRRGKFGAYPRSVRTKEQWGTLGWINEAAVRSLAVSATPEAPKLTPEARAAERKAKNAVRAAQVQIKANSSTSGIAIPDSVVDLMPYFRVLADRLLPSPRRSGRNADRHVIVAEDLAIFLMVTFAIGPKADGAMPVARTIRAWQSLYEKEKASDSPRLSRAPSTSRIAALRNDLDIRCLIKWEDYHYIAPDIFKPDDEHSPRKGVACLWDIVAALKELDPRKFVETITRQDQRQHGEGEDQQRDKEEKRKRQEERRDITRYRALVMEAFPPGWEAREGGPRALTKPVRVGWASQGVALRRQAA